MERCLNTTRTEAISD